MIGDGGGGEEGETRERVSYNHLVMGALLLQGTGWVFGSGS